MQEPLDVLERRIDQVRGAVRAALAEHDVEQVRELQSELRRLQRAWDELVSLPPERGAGRHGALHPGDASGLDHARAGAPMLPAREMVHRILTLLQVPAAPRLIVEVHAAFFPEALPAGRLSTLRRDEERSYRASPNSRPYYLCPALTHDSFAPARGLLTVSTWPLAERIVGPLSPRTGFLRSAIRIAELVADPPGGTVSAEAARLLNRYALNIPGAASNVEVEDAPPHAVAASARAELDVHEHDDRCVREAAARRARGQLSETLQLFGARLSVVQEHSAEG